MMSTILSIIVSILAFGAVADNDSVNNAAAIDRAITSCAEQGGGTVVIPSGTFTTGTIHLRSHVTLRLERGAVLRGTRHLDAYEPLRTSLDLSHYESGQGTDNYNSATDPIWSIAMIMAVGVSDAGIEGEGVIDGADVRNPLGEEHQRGPHALMMAGCDNMHFSGITIRRASNYAIMGYRVDRARFSRLCILGGWDGIHLRGAKRVTITDCDIHTGDDAVAGGYWEDFTLRRSRLNSSCNGVRMIMPSDGVTFEDLYVYGPGMFEHITSHRTSSGWAFNIEPGAWGLAPGRLDNIRIRRCHVQEVLSPLAVTLGEDNSLGTITVDHLVARDITRMALSVKSWGKAPTDRVIIRHADMEFRGIDDPALPASFEGKPTSEWPVFPSWGMYFRNVKKLKTHDIKLSVTGKDYRPDVIVEK